jgi:hypothetical protein
MLISEEYKVLQVKAHVDKPDWGRASVAYAGNVADFCKHYGTKLILDYGCGKQRLRDCMVPYNIEVTGYDPGIEGLDTPPVPHDYVVCIDVLEHVEPECVDAVLDDLLRVTKKVGLLTISTLPARATLADGSNAHRTVRPMKWWVEKLAERFDVHVLTQAREGFAVTVMPL